jgi:polysaccharide export outer membrane protein
MIKSLLCWIPIAVLMFLLGACGSTRKLQYMQGAFDTARLSTFTVPPPVIQKGDLLSIIVFSDNPAATALYNQSVIVATSGATGSVTTGTASSIPSATGTGYLVDDEGYIQFQGIGKLHIDGLTKSQLTDLLNSKLKEFLQNPYYNIRFLNYKITLVGDVAKPGVYSIPSERVNLLEAIGLAGDLNITARRDNVLVIREQNGKREFGRIDLTKPDIFNSPFYQLQQNDMIYVDLNKTKAATSDQTALRNISIATSIISTIAILITVFRR